MLIGARALQGLGAALATPAALALVTGLFPAGAQRTKALTLWGALSGLGFAAGVLAGGVITQAASWRWVFFINIPIAAACGRGPAPGGREPQPRPGRLRPGRAITITAGMSTLVYTLLEGARYGWTSATTLGLFAVAAALLGAFAVIESRAAVPLIPARFVHRRATLAPTISIWVPTGRVLLLLHAHPVPAAGPGLQPAADRARLHPDGRRRRRVQRDRQQARAALRAAPAGRRGLALVGAGLVLLGHAPADGTYLANVLPAWS